MGLRQKIEARLKEKQILLCSHAVVGYPSLRENPEAIKLFCQAGVDIMELQFPFSDPTADGPILLHANQAAVEAGTKVDDGFALARQVTRDHPETMFLIMTYYNIIFSRGVERFAREAQAAGILGVIIPDLPVEEALPWVDACKAHNLAPIFLVTPDTKDARIKAICTHADGFLYCVARKGITGMQTKFGPEFEAYLKRVKSCSSLPTGVGFGVRTKEDVTALTGKTEIAIVCSQAIAILGKDGAKAAANFLKALR